MSHDEKELTEEKKVPEKTNAVTRALDILEYLTYSTTPVSVSDLSRHFGINRATTYSLLNSLIQKDYIHRNSLGKYFISSRIFELGTVYQNSFPLVHLVKRSSFQFTNMIKCTCKLTILSSNWRALILYSRSTEDQIMQLSLGYTFPLHTSACGKVLMAYAPPEMQEIFLEQCEFEKYTDKTITDKEVYRKDLEQVRKNGFGIDDCEYAPNQICLAAPVFNNKGSISAISVSGKADDVRPHMEQLTHDLLLFTRGLSLELGYTFPETLPR